MKTWQIVLFVIVMVLAAVAILSLPAYRPNMDRKEAPEGAPNSFTPTGRFGPDKHGVVCYRYLESIDCVRVQ
jgi:hypothetical protein